MLQDERWACVWWNGKIHPSLIKSIVVTSSHARRGKKPWFYIISGLYPLSFLYLQVPQEVASGSLVQCHISSVISTTCVTLPSGMTIHTGYPPLNPCPWWWRPLKDLTLRNTYPSRPKRSIICGVLTEYFWCDPHLLHGILSSSTVI